MLYPPTICLITPTLFISAHFRLQFFRRKSIIIPMASVSSFAYTCTSSRVSFPLPRKISSSTNTTANIYGRRKQRALSVSVKAISRAVDVSKVLPQGDRVVIRLESLPKESTGGVLLPTSAVKFDRYLLGEVVSVGPEVETIETGKKVLLSDLNAYEIDLGTPEKIVVCKEGDLMATVE